MIAPDCGLSLDCTDAVPMGVNRAQTGDLGLFRICKLQILNVLALSWFESMSGSHTFWL